MTLYDITVTILQQEGKKRNLLKATLKIEANFSVNLLLVTCMILYALSELVTRNQIFTI